MFSEAHFSGILFAPIVIYCLIAFAVFLPARYLLGRLGVLNWVWHAALFELSLYACIAAFIILLAA